jgi:polar amino acid transport system substrate-binding protein
MHACRRDGFVIVAALCLAAATAGPAAGAPLAEIRERGVLRVCAHPAALPFSSQEPGQPGIQLELAEAVAKKLGVRVHVDWILYTRHARRLECDALMGSIVQGGAARPDARRGPRLTKPYAGGGYQLVVPASAPAVRGPEDIKNGKIGVEHTSWPHYLLNTRGIPTGSYLNQTEILEAVAKGELAGGLVTGPYLGWFLKQHPGAAVRAVTGWVPEPELRWNVAVGLHGADQPLLDAVNRAIDQLLAAREIQAIFARYGVPYAPPLSW